MKTICKVLKPFTEEGAYYPAGSEIVLERKRAMQLGDLVLIEREIEEKVGIVKKAKTSKVKRESKNNPLTPFDKGELKEEQC